MKYEGAWWDEQAQFASTPGKDVLSNPESQAASLGWQVSEAMHDHFLVGLCN